MRNARINCSKSLLLALLLGPSCGDGPDRKDGLENDDVGPGGDADDDDDGSTEGDGAEDGAEDGDGSDGGGDDAGSDGSDGDGGESDGSSDDGGTDAGGSGTGTDCHSDVEWGNGGHGNTPIDQDIGQVIANWSLTGYIDQDGDGIVETEQVSFTMEDVHCTGKKSMIVLMGDTY